MIVWSRIPRSPFFKPTLAALLLHLCGIAVAMVIQIHPDEAKTPAEDRLRFNVKGVSTGPILVKHTSNATNPDSKLNSLRFVKKGQKSAASLPLDAPVDKLAQAPAPVRHTSDDVAPKKIDLRRTGPDETKDLNSILIDTEESKLKEDVQVRQRSTTGGPSDVGKMVAGHKADMQKVVQSLSGALRGLGLSDGTSLDLDPDEGMPGFTPMEGTFGNADIDQGSGESRGDILKYDSLDDFLDIQVSTYEDPKDHQKYFMMKIFAKPNAKALNVMPKEILFAIDCSLSISPERLGEFKRGISQCLSNLNKDDVFNIVAFRDKAFLFSPKSVKATPDIIKKAERFVSDLTSNRTTDVYNAFENIIRSDLARKPSSVILISDGRPTHGIQDSRELINSVTRLNHKVRPIFAYSGGAKVNRYLLDFLSYQNRAWSQYVKERGQIHKGLSDFYSKIKDPIFLNLRYRLNGLNEDEVFPKSLPDFYRNAEFTLFGKFENENDFSMQLLGDFGEETKELIFSRSLKDAQKGGPEIMKGYAFNRVYHLISQATTQGQSPALMDQIHKLSAQYGVTTPYSAELDVKD